MLIRWSTILIAGGCILGAANFAALAQDPKSKDCTQKSTEVPATSLEKGANSGAKNMGTTGWSGGMRDPGSGSASDKEPKTSAEQQPETAKGIDPTKDKSPAC